MNGDENSENDKNPTQTLGPEGRKLAPNKNLTSIRDIMQSIRQEEEHEMIMQLVLVLRLYKLYR